MKQLQPVIWSKGTFLTPQHLQTQDRYIEDLLKFRIQTLKFCPWGFKELAINRELLAEGQFAVSRASGIFPDGLLFDIPDTDPPPPSRPLKELFVSDDAKSADIYLTIPDLQERGANVSGTIGANTRYLAEATVTTDENTGRGEKGLQVARKNLRLLGDGDNLTGSSALRMANVERTEAGACSLSDRFVPPLIRINASDHLLGLLRGLLELLSAKSNQLAGMRRQKNQSLADFTASDIANFWLLYTVNSHFPLFSHLFKARNCHPEELFSAMVSLAGSLTTFSEKVQPRDLPAYDHDSLTEVFADLDAKLRSLLETVVPLHVISLPLQLQRNYIYATSIDQEKYLVNTRMFLAFSADVNEVQIIQRVPQVVTLCSERHIDHLINKALPGIQMSHTPNPPSEIPFNLKYQYFALNQSGPAWEAVRRGRNFAAFVPPDFPNPSLELLILLPRNG